MKSSLKNHWEDKSHRVRGAIKEFVGMVDMNSELEDEEDEKKAGNIPQKIIDLAPMRILAEKKNTIIFSSILGGISLVGGIVILTLIKKKS